MAPTYYATAPKHVRVLNSHGVNAYRSSKLAGKAMRYYRVGQVLKIKTIKHYHLTTRFQLTNGHYITANKTLVIKK
ncbi:DUF5776 domain-containing protein [Levilactobacillus tangyuanensis]|uniref:DUF5776 domain-containing protein n=1 Tax=Levilactobacillus tangyuanensis TaxID=2486021 RepID=A0ABW1TN68_9LACO|nr:DUF5776 domain-containing protein [Levilactobacillus tangyuanensis]